MRNLLIGLAVCVGLGLASSAHAQSTTTSSSTSTSTSSTTSTTSPCHGGTIKCDAQCDGAANLSGFAVCAGANSGLSFTGNCAGAPADKNAAGKACAYIHCGGTAVCIGGPWTTTGCSADANCASGEVCISDNGTAGCGTGFSQCVKKCE